MSMKMRRRTGAVMVVVAALLAVVATGPLGWGFGVVLAILVGLAGASLATARHPYDHVRDGF
jgi:uncharacterized membrane protein YccC